VTDSNERLIRGRNDGLCYKMVKDLVQLLPMIIWKEENKPYEFVVLEKVSW
jgi:hypothetical protein